MGLDYICGSYIIFFRKGTFSVAGTGFFVRFFFVTGIKKLTEIELQIKKNYQNSVNMTLDFILNEVRRTSN